MHNYKLQYLIILALLSFNGFISSAQNQGSDTIIYNQTSVNKGKHSDNTKNSAKLYIDTVEVKKHSPKKAAWMSAVLPGLGQIYNKKYWKVPIIYVGFGIFTYLGYNYYTKFHHYESTYLVRSNIDPNSKDYYPEITNPDILYNNFTYYRRNFELTCIFGSLFYVLNIIDASVDAHLFKFDISDELTMKFTPEIINYNYSNINNSASGLKISFNF